ncbi:MAG TPA: type II toxin-antitoxin system RelE/ParE family toxin [Planctomycetota bacterium]|nr:type II toxin-antitoxin system RelE/ParE family toxin [Planctomycetota bacterium]
MAQVSWSPSSLLDLDSIADFIARDSAHFASLFVQSIVAKVEKLSEFPLSGRVVPEYGREDLREFIFENYRIVYRVRGDLIEVAAVIHGARELPQALP